MKWYSDVKKRQETEAYCKRIGAAINMRGDSMEDLLSTNKYTDIILINREGKILFSDVGPVQFLKKGERSLTGLNIKDVFPDITEDYPLLRAIRTGKAVSGYTQTLRTNEGAEITVEGAAYPVYLGRKPVAAFQFSEVLYDRKYLSKLENVSDNVIYRANNTKYILRDIITQDAEMMRIKEKIQEYANSDVNVFIYGETGTGKELIAQSLHNCSRRFFAPFISQNCGAIPENLLEGILFGTTKGSYTGAEDRAGLFELAEGGTIFLDEINSMSTDLQAKILRAVERKKIRRIGSLDEKEVDVRIISATNVNPYKLIEKKQIKPDLFYRLAVLYIEVPPLSRRRGDVELLTNYFISYFNRKMHSEVALPSRDIMKILRGYGWPGNVRELRNVIEGAVALSENDEIHIEDIPDYIVRRSQYEKEEKYARGLYSEIREIEDNIIRQQLKIDNGKLSEAAEHLGMSKQLLWYKMKRQE